MRSVSFVAAASGAARNLTELAQACHEFEEVQVSIELIGKGEICTCRDRFGSFGVERLFLVVQHATTMCVALGLKKRFVE